MGLSAFLLTNQNAGKEHAFFPPPLQLLEGLCPGLLVRAADAAWFCNRAPSGCDGKDVDISSALDGLQMGIMGIEIQLGKNSKMLFAEMSRCRLVFLFILLSLF